jgi:predicted nucleotidyltransferase component of viral defense system
MRSSDCSYRLSISDYKDKFVLKGAILLRHWLDDPHRPTRDLDLLGFGDSDPKLTLGAFKEICAIADNDDGVTFDIDSLAVDTVRDESGYGGLRLKGYALIDGARLRIVIDIGYGDATEPGLDAMTLTTLLDNPSPNLRAYPPETVIAEKFQAMVHLGFANSRLKDYYDIWMLARMHALKTIGCRARSRRPSPAERRKSRRNGLTLLARLSPGDATKLRQWAAFLQDVAVDPGTLGAVIEELAAFLMAQAAEARRLTD